MLKGFKSRFPGDKLREKIVAMLGASPTQYRLLLKTEKLVEKRALAGKNDLSNTILAATHVFCFIIGIGLTLMPFLIRMDTFTYALIGITMSMIIGLWTMPHLDILLTPIHYPVIAHTPVSSRTYFLVKLTQLMSHVVLWLASFNLLPAIGGIWLRPSESSQFQFFFPIVYLPIAFMSGFFTIGVMTTFAGYLTKLYNKKALRDIAQYAQLMFMAVFPAVMMFILYYRILPAISKEKLISSLKWFDALPNGWFAATVSLALGQIERSNIVRNLILAGLAVASTLFLVLVPLRDISKSYSKYLSNLLESGSGQKSKLRVKTSLFARMFRNPTVRAGFCLGSAYMYRDQQIVRQLLASLGITLGMVFAFSQDNIFSLKWIRDSVNIGLSPGFSILFWGIGISLTGCFILAIRYSEHYKASWILTLASLQAPRALWRGVQAAALLYIVVPWTLLMLCIAIAFWGILGIFYILPGLIVFLNVIALSVKPRSGLPLAEEFVQKRMPSAIWVSSLSNIFSSVFVGIQFLTHVIHTSAYYGFYCITVVGGLISLFYFYEKRKA